MGKGGAPAMGAQPEGPTQGQNTCFWVLLTGWMSTPLCWIATRYPNEKLLLKMGTPQPSRSALPLQVRKKWLYILILGLKPLSFESVQSLQMRVQKLSLHLLCSEELWAQKGGPLFCAMCCSFCLGTELLDTFEETHLATSFKTCSIQYSMYIYIYICISVLYIPILCSYLSCIQSWSRMEAAKRLGRHAGQGWA